MNCSVFPRGTPVLFSDESRISRSTQVDSDCGMVRELGARFVPPVPGADVTHRHEVTGHADVVDVGTSADLTGGREVHVREGP